MSRPVTRPQKAAGLAAALTAAAFAVMPLAAGVNGVSANKKLLAERQASSVALEERIRADRTEIQRDARGYARIQQPFDVETVARQLGAQCAAFADELSAVSVRQNCNAMQTPLGGGLQQHTATLAISGPPGDLLRALDAFPTLDVSLDQFRLTTDPASPNEATLTLRFSDVSDMPGEAQP